MTPPATRHPPDSSPLTPNASRVAPNGFFIVGTDTGVGKTLVAAALLHAYADLGYRVVGMKPVAAGAESSDGLTRVWFSLPSA